MVLLNPTSDRLAPANRPPSPIAFVDLAAQQDRIRVCVERAMARVLEHGHYIMGPEVEALEQQLAAFSGARHALTCASGTDALLIAMMALGVQAGDAVLCPAFIRCVSGNRHALTGTHGNDLAGVHTCINQVLANCSSTLF